MMKMDEMKLEAYEALVKGWTVRQCYEFLQMIKNCRCLIELVNRYELDDNVAIDKMMALQDFVNRYERSLQ